MKMGKGDKYSYVIRSEKIETNKEYSITHEFSGQVPNPSTLSQKNQTADLIRLHENFLHNPKRKSIESNVTEVIE